MKSVLCVLVIGFVFSGCSSLQRSQGSGYALRDEGGSTFERRPLRQQSPEVQRFAAEMGFSPHESLTHAQWRQLEDRRRLKALEARLSNSREKEQYSKILPWLADDAEKIEMLSIPSLEGRQAWINSKQIWRRSQQPPATVRSIIESGDIAVGMQMEYVRRAWGEPQTVEVSGNPAYKNERWRYDRFVSSQDGYRQEKRFVYFEGGRVVGWETE